MNGPFKGQKKTREAIYCGVVSWGCLKTLGRGGKSFLLFWAYFLLHSVGVCLEYTYLACRETGRGPKGGGELVSAKQKRAMYFDRAGIVKRNIKKRNKSETNGSEQLSHFGNFSLAAPVC